jgi:hypothetical protein
MPKNTFVLDINILVVSEGEIFSLATQFKWGNDKLEKLQTFLDTLNIIPINNPQLVKAYVAGLSCLLAITFLPMFISHKHSIIT